MIAARSLQLPVPGGSLHVETAGEGPPLILIHGFSLDARMWEPQMADFIGAHRVIRYDLRGFGRSSLPTGPYSHLDDLLAVMDALGIEQAVLVGLSLGANVAGAFTLEHRDRVAGLVLASSGLPGHNWREQRPPEVAEAYAREHGIEAGRQAWLHQELFAAALARPAVAAALAVIVGEYSGWHWANLNPMRKLPPLGARLGEIDVAALVITGARDVAGYREIGDALAAGLPKARRVELPEVGHMVNMEAPETFGRLVLEFCREVGPPALPPIRFNLEAPGTFVFTGLQSSRGYRLNKFALSLKQPENRAAFLADEAAYVQRYGLTDSETELVRARDWTELLRAGGHLQAILKLAATTGQSLWHIGAHNAGVDVETLRAACPRRVAEPAEQR